MSGRRGRSPTGRRALRPGGPALLLAMMLLAGLLSPNPAAAADDLLGGRPVAGGAVPADAVPLTAGLHRVTPPGPGNRGWFSYSRQWPGSRLYYALTVVSDLSALKADEGSRFGVGLTATPDGADCGQLAFAGASPGEPELTSGGGRSKPACAEADRVYVYVAQLFEPARAQQLQLVIYEEPP
ncbi:MAG: hypothetical protein R2731_08165 [Nocardioides sp.]